MNNKLYITIFFLAFTNYTYAMDKKTNVFPNRAQQQLAINAMQSSKERCIEKTNNRKNTTLFQNAQTHYAQTVQKVRQTSSAIAENQVAFADFQLLDSTLEQANETQNYKQITPKFTNAYESALEKVNTTHKALAIQLRAFAKPTMVDAETQTDSQPVEMKEESESLKKSTVPSPVKTKFQAGLLQLLQSFSEDEQAELFNEFDATDMAFLKEIDAKYFPANVESSSAITTPETEQEAHRTNTSAIKPATVTLTPKQMSKKLKRQKKRPSATDSTTNQKPGLVAGMKSAEISLIQASQNLLEVSRTSQKIMKNMLNQKDQELAALNHPHSENTSKQQVTHDLKQKLQRVIDDRKTIPVQQYDDKDLLKQRLFLNTRSGRPKRVEVVSRAVLLGAEITQTAKGNARIDFTQQGIDEAHILGLPNKKQTKN